ncbi:hypothetical protein VBD025_11785 [Virgibacillus flavescens]
MRNFDWQMILFLGSSFVHDYWIYWGLPRIYYLDIKQEKAVSEVKKAA